MVLDNVTKQAILLVEANKLKKEFPENEKRADERFEDGFAVQSTIAKQLEEQSKKVKLSSEEMAKLNGKMAEINKLSVQNPEEYGQALASSVPPKTPAMKTYLFERVKGNNVYDAGTIAEVGTKKLSKEMVSASQQVVWERVEEEVFKSAPNPEERNIFKAMEDDRQRVNNTKGAYPLMTMINDGVVSTYGVYSALNDLTKQKGDKELDEAKKERLLSQLRVKPEREVNAFAVEAMRNNAQEFGNKNDRGVFTTVFMQGMAKGLGPKLSYSLVRWDVSNTIKSEDKPFNRFQELKHKSSKNITRPSAGDEIKNAEKERVNSLPLPNKALEYAKMAGKER